MGRSEFFTTELVGTGDAGGPEVGVTVVEQTMQTHRQTEKSLLRVHGAEMLMVRCSKGLAGKNYEELGVGARE